MTRTDAFKKHRGSVFSLIAFVGLFIVRLIFPERPIDYVGPRALLDSVFALGFLLFLLLLAWGIGIKILSKVNLLALSQLNKWLFSMAIGLGVLAYGVLALGLVGILSTTTVLLWLGLAALLARQELEKVSNAIPKWALRIRQTFLNLSSPEKGLVVLAFLILFFSSVQALTPPWGYDALMYHLEAPRLWLEAKRITLLPDIWQPNGPMTIEMLFTIGLAIQSDVLARLIHLFFTALVFLLCFSLGKDLLGRTGGWLSVAVLLGIPILPLWGALAYAEMALVLYTLLALLAIRLSIISKQGEYLFLAGLMMGWALGSKYTALGSFAVLGIWILWQRRREELSTTARAAAIFGLAAIIVASPWYLKNLFLSGNPVYPFVFGGPGWDETRLDAVMYFLRNGFGVGRTLLDYISLPLNVYTQPGNFSTVFGTLDFPGFLFPLVVLYPIARRKIKLDWLVGIIIALFLFWALGSQQTRFLITLYPLLSIVTASVILWLGNLIPQESLRRVLAISLVGGLVAVTAAYQAIFLFDTSPHTVVFGVESKQSFLTREVFDYPAIQYAEEVLGENENLLMMWDGQGYYCGQKCIPDPDQTRLYLLTKSVITPEDLGKELKLMGTSHILVDVKGLSFFYLHDPDGRHQRAANYFFQQFVPSCGDQVFADEDIYIYEISCVE